MQELSPETYRQYNGVLNEMLSGEKGQEYQLPRLVYEKGPFAELLEKIREWLNRKTSFSTPSGTWDLSAFFIFIKWVLLAALFALLLWGIYRLILHYQNKSIHLSPRQPLPLQGTQIFDLESSMGQKIKKALEQNELDRAGRLRWKLFLMRTHQDLFLTPQEFECYPVQKKIAGPHFRGSESQNQLMFGKQPKAIEDYRTFDLSLIEIENNYVSHAA